MRPSGTVRVVVVAIVLATVAALRLLAVSGWDPTSFTAFGADSVEITDYAEQELGRDVKTRALQGHDGKFFFVLANDPLLLDPEENAAVLDRQRYRSQRILYPLVAGAGGIFPPEVIVWSLIVVNVLALAIGAWAVAGIARKHGVSEWWGLAFLLNVGLLSELYIDGAGILAFALACVGVLALEHDRPGLAGVVFAASALTREVMLAFVCFIALFWLIRKRAIPWLVVAPAVLTVALWAWYVRIRLPAVEGVDQVKELTLTPFSGLAEAVTSGRAEAADLLLIFVFACLLVLVPVRAWKSDIYLTWGAVGFAVLAPFLTVFVWQKSWDISRALAPLVTAFLIEFAVARKRQHEDASQALNA
jgi:hypothetical protein